MLDVHHHLLPGIDDGPAAIEESVEAATRAVADGVHTIAATPHLREDHPDVRPEELAGRCLALAARLTGAGIDLDVVVGAEVDITWARDASDEDLRLASYGQRGRDLLVETPYGHLPSTFEALLFEIQVRGYRLVLAHPERNPTLQADPGRLEELVHRGVLVQLTAGALVGERRSSSSQRLALYLLGRGLAHVIATDGHGPGRRDASLSDALRAAQARIGEPAASMVTTAPAAILAGEAVVAPPAQASRTRRWFRR
jgi:protein-tyrosine phosphatase